MATEMTVFEAARAGELRVLRKWLDTERDVNRKYVACSCAPAPHVPAESLRANLATNPR